MIKTKKRVNLNTVIIPYFYTLREIQALEFNPHKFYRSDYEIEGYILVRYLIQQHILTRQQGKGYIAAFRSSTCEQKDVYEALQNIYENTCWPHLAHLGGHLGLDGLPVNLGELSVYLREKITAHVIGKLFLEYMNYYSEIPDCMFVYSKITDFTHTFMSYKDIVFDVTIDVEDHDTQSICWRIHDYVKDIANTIQTQYIFY